MITIDHYRRTLDEFDRRARGVRSDQWGSPTTCCPDWDVAALVGHVAEETAWVAPLLHGVDADSAADQATSLSSSEPATAWSTAARAARDAVAEATIGPDDAVHLPSGDVPTGDYLAEVCCDTLIHTWDLAAAVGGDRTLDPQLVQACGEWFDRVEDRWRSGGAIGPPADTPADADAQTRLLARFGRQP